MEKISKGNKDITVTTASAGNHGRSVAWGAKRLGLKCKIFISEFVSDARGKAMSELGADVIKVKGNYEKSLIECIEQSINVRRAYPVVLAESHVLYLATGKSL